MIFVIADDFSGAAEISGVGLRYGLKCSLQTDLNWTGEPDLLVIDTDTRSLPESEALLKLSTIIDQLAGRSCDWLYKKIDSVLRGHILAEIRLVMNMLDIRTTVLAPANPSAGRTIRGGCYYINGVPLDKTGFAEDPEYPARSADVRILLDPDGKAQTVYSDAIGDTLLPGIIIGGARSREDLRRWAELIPGDGLPVGSSEFFENILDIRGHRPVAGNFLKRLEWRRGKHLVVLGSAGRHINEHIARLISAGFVICKWPGSHADLDKPDYLERWIEAVERAFKEKDHIVLTTGLPLNNLAGVPKKIAHLTAVAVKRICSLQKIRFLFIAGGATAAHIIRELGWKHMRPVVEFSTGVVALRASEKDDLTVIVKPGSYPWPALDFLNSQKGE